MQVLAPRDVEMRRTQWAEHVAAQIASKPLVQECVYSNARYFRRSEKEVCDILLILKKRGILIQMKCQEDPNSQPSVKLDPWVKKKAKEALAQLKGAIRTVDERDFWCNHARRGRVEFRKGELSVLHGVVLVENLSRRVLLTPDNLLEHRGVPISYFSVSDFLNITEQLRAFPEILTYFELRRGLGDAVLRAIGGERVLFEHYLLNKGTFHGWSTYETVQKQLSASAEELTAMVGRKVSADSDAHLIEFVCDALAERSDKYMEGLSEEWNRHFDGVNGRKKYLQMQEELADLRLAERRELGSQFNRVIRQVEESQRKSELCYASASFDSKPDFVYVLAASRAIDRETLFKRGFTMLKGALSHYRKTRGMIIIDREGESFELMYIPSFVANDRDGQAGEILFKSLKVFDRPATLIPPEES